MDIDENRQKLGEFVKFSVQNKFQHDVRNVSVVGNPPTSILVEISGNNVKYQSDIQSVEKHVQEIFRLIVVTDIDVTVSASKDKAPSILLLLNALKTRAPISSEELSEIFLRRDYSIADPKWISLRLDSLRKQGLVTRRSDQKYVLTFSGLIKLGSRRSGQSTDVRRALEMARWRS